MNRPSSFPSHSAGLTPQECVRLLSKHRRVWLTPTLVCTILAAAYAVVMPRNWKASQALVVRREVNTSSAARPGKFADLYEMRTFQETILELAKSQQVIAATLQAVKQAETGNAAPEPAADAIDTFRKRLAMSPPGGAEFGKTEVFYMSVKDKNRERAIRLVAELCRQLDNRLRQLRDEQAQSLTAELQQQFDLASSAHQEQTRKLAAFEASVGADLGELRMLNASFSGQSDLRQQAIALEAESRQAQLQVRDAEQLLLVLEKSQQDPDQLVAMPNSLLTSQPTLRQLKDGLVAAQLRAARLMGTRTEEHPQVQAAHDSVTQIRQDLRNELQVAVQGVQVELDLSRNRSANLEKQSAELHGRLGKLAALRAEYANHISAAENSRLVLDQAGKQLGEVRAAQAAAQNVSLVTLIDKPETGPHPVGLGRASVLVMGTFGGLVLGLGWVFLTVTPPSALMSNPVATAAHGDAPVELPPTKQPAKPRRSPAGVPPSVAAKIAEIMSIPQPDVTPEISIPRTSASNGSLPVNQ
ncbi:MAG: Wzz/FepE/Etk N-terminal domain-containing protein [Pirellulales bacterium]|nr:Wzz/FepE/Etk N-terminal domain-containing protein [Pirellulales bacterium]